MNLTNLLMALVTAWSLGTADVPPPPAPTPTATVFEDALTDHAAALAGYLGEPLPAYAEEDVDALARLIYWEARGESERGQLAVANVVLNRARDRRWPDTIADVIAQKDQFTPYDDARYFKVKVPEKLKTVARRALGGERAVPDDYFFFSVGKPTRYAKDFIRIGNHYFGKAK